MALTRRELRTRLVAATSSTAMPVARMLDVSATAPPNDLVSLSSGRRKLTALMHRDDDIRRLSTRLLGVNSITTDVGLRVYNQEPDSHLEEMQGQFLESLIGAITNWAAHGVQFDDKIADLVRTASSATPAGFAFRALFAPTRFPAPGPGMPENPPEPTGGRPPLVGLPPVGLPNLPKIPEKHLGSAIGNARSLCAGIVTRGLARWGEAMANAQPRYTSNSHITGLEPVDGCAGDLLEVHGSGFGSGQQRALAFTGPNQKAVLVLSRDVSNWADDLITVHIPVEARRGPVAIVDLPSRAAPNAAAEAFVNDVAACFGAVAVERMRAKLAATYPSLGSPPMQQNNANAFNGGPPEIRSFYKSPAGQLWPGMTLQLTWNVDNATRVEIVAEDVDGADNELPDVPGVLASSGSVSMVIPGTRRWKGRYVLRAFNRCVGDQPVEQTIEVEMFLRNGLALGGGGTRGDFQAGALLYLYDEVGLRPDAIASTSVGSINAVELLMGDDADRSAASRLRDVWVDDLMNERSMWDEELWLTTVKARLRSDPVDLAVTILINPLGGLIAAAVELDAIERLLASALSLFNLKPIERLMRARWRPERNTHVPTRMLSVSVETADRVAVDEEGRVISAGPTPTRGPWVTPPPPVDVIQGALASASMPGIFPARRLGDHMCVDGGVRDVVPVVSAVRDLGCNRVYAIRNSAPVTPLNTDPLRNGLTTAMRSVMQITYDEIADEDLIPFGGLGDVEIITIDSSLDLHDPLVVEPGLIRIAIDYGWMRAGDVIAVGELRQYARDLSDEITGLRAANWQLAHWVLGIQWADPHRSLDAFLAFGGAKSPDELNAEVVHDPLLALRSIRSNCHRIRELIQQRLYIDAPLPSMGHRSAWFLEWEAVDVNHAPRLATPWSDFELAGVLVLEAEAAPASL